MYDKLIKAINEYYEISQVDKEINKMSKELTKSLIEYYEIMKMDSD